MLGNLRRRIGGLLSSATLARLHAWEFTALVLALLTAAAWMAANGLESLSVQRRNGYAARVRAQASSPVPYGKPVPRAAALLGPAGAWHAFVRADSVPAAAERERLCALAAGGAAGVRWLALSDDVPACLRAASPLAVPAGERAAVKAELRSARWGVVDAEGRVRHNRRGAPTVGEVRRTLALLHPEGIAVAALPPEAAESPAQPALAAGVNP